MNQYTDKNGKYSINPEKIFTNKIVNDTLKYQKQYGFQIGKNNSTWNNEADAFKHTYMQAQLALFCGKIGAEIIGNSHEQQGAKRGQPTGESNMDLWNNQQGREIAKEIISQYGVLSTIPSREVNDIIAEKVMQRMREGKLITNPNDTRKYKDVTGFASDIVQEKIFTREEIGKMSPDEFSQNEIAIDKQLKTIGIPKEAEAQQAVQNGELIWVEPYTRTDGTQVSGYYRTK